MFGLFIILFYTLLMTDLMDVKELADVLRVEVPTVQRWLREGKLPFIQPGRKKLVRRSDLEMFIEGSTLKATVNINGSR